MTRGPWSLGGADLSALADVTGVSRSVAPERRLLETEVPGMDGELARAGGLKPLEVTVSAHLRARTVDDVSRARRALAALLVADDPLPLVLPDEPGTWLGAVYEGGAELSRNAHRPRVELRFLCPDPAAHGERRQAQVATGATTVRTGGTWRSWPTVTARPAKGSYWQLYDLGSGRYVRVYAAFDGAQTVVLDTAEQRCRVNGADHAVYVGSDYFPLEGDMRLVTSSGTATLEWDERWV